jgi:hypothetical protein
MACGISKGNRMPCYPVATDEDLEGWDAFVERPPQGVHPQLSWWMRRREFALPETGVVVAREGGRICGGAALYHFGLPYAGRGATIAPNGPLVEAGHLGCLPDLVRAIVQEGRRRKAILIQFKAFAAPFDAPLRQAARTAGRVGLRIRVAPNPHSHPLPGRDRHEGRRWPEHAIFNDFPRLLDERPGRGVQAWTPGPATPGKSGQEGKT